MERIQVPIWEKACLTIEEAAAYSNIGEGRLREMAKDPLCPFALRVNAKTLIKKKQFLEFIDKTNVL